MTSAVAVQVTIYLNEGDQWRSKPLAVEIPDAGSEPEAEEVVGAEDHLRVAVGVGGVLLDRQHGLVVQDSI